LILVWEYLIMMGYKFVYKRMTVMKKAEEIAS